MIGTVLLSNILSSYSVIFQPEKEKNEQKNNRLEENVKMLTVAASEWQHPG